MTGDKTVGIPRYLGYFTYWPLWETFFEELGFDIRTSPPSNKAILDRGVGETVSDACVPIKLFHGHVLSLQDRADFLFVPRLAGTTTRYTFCPKFLGLPDMVRHSVGDLPEILSPRLQIQGFGRQILGHMVALAGRIAGSRFAAIRAMLSARKMFRMKTQQLLREGISALGFEVPTDPQLKVGVVGYPYVVYDRLTGGGVINQLGRLGAAVLTPEMVEERHMRRQSREFSEDLFWYYSNRSLWSGLHFMKNGLVDGLMHITAFGCGPDAMVSKLLEIEARNRNVPFTSVMVDEHTGDVGLKTRTEAFTDMLRWQMGGRTWRG